MSNVDYRQWLIGQIASGSVNIGNPRMVAKVAIQTADEIIQEERNANFDHRNCG